MNKEDYANKELFEPWFGEVIFDGDVAGFITISEPKVIIFVSELDNYPTLGGVLLSEKDEVGKITLFPPDNKIEDIIKVVRDGGE